MSKEFKRAYDILRMKDAFDALESIAYRITMIMAIASMAIVAFMGTSSPLFAFAMVLTFAVAVAYFICLIASVVCEAMLEKSGHSEIELERMACH